MLLDALQNVCVIHDHGLSHLGRYQHDGLELMRTKPKLLAGLRLRAARTALGYDQVRGRTQANFYRLFGYTKGSGNNWEKGVAYPRPEFLVALQERFDVGPDWILCEIPGGLPARISQQVVDNFEQLKRDAGL